MTAVAHYVTHPTPIGEALIVMTDKGLAYLHVLEGRAEEVNDLLAAATRTLGGLILPDDDGPARVAEQLDEYFSGTRLAFEVPLDLSRERGFIRRALDAVCEIPFGQLASYGEVAIMAGSPGASRAVGTACARTPISIVVPAHRVVRSDGSIGEYGGHPEIKRFLIDLEDRVVRAATGV